ncbi:hypothetical protein ACLOJK_041294 [Asimina triloba]
MHRRSTIIRCRRWVRQRAAHCPIQADHLLHLTRQISDLQTASSNGSTNPRSPWRRKQQAAMAVLPKNPNPAMNTGSVVDASSTHLLRATPAPADQRPIGVQSQQGSDPSKIQRAVFTIARRQQKGGSLPAEPTAHQHQIQATTERISLHLASIDEIIAAPCTPAHLKPIRSRRSPNEPAIIQPRTSSSPAVLPDRRVKIVHHGCCSKSSEIGRHPHQSAPSGPCTTQHPASTPSGQGSSVRSGQPIPIHRPFDHGTIRQLDPSRAVANSSCIKKQDSPSSPCFMQKLGLQIKPNSSWVKTMPTATA